jgi:hypothetical protein
LGVSLPPLLEGRETPNNLEVIVETVTVKGSDLRSGMVVDHVDCCGYSYKDTLKSVKVYDKVVAGWWVHRSGLWNDEFPDGGEIDENRAFYVRLDRDYEVLA